MLRTALRNVLAHKARLLMTILAVLLGVAFVSGTLIFTGTLGHAFQAQSTKNYSGVAVSVTGPEKGLDTQDLARLRGLDGVSSVTGRVSGFAGASDREGRLIGGDLSTTGTDYAPGPDGKDPAYAFVSGQGPRTDGQIALDKRSAATGHYKVGDRVRVATDGALGTYTLSGIYTTDDGQVSVGGSMILFDTSVAQRLYATPGHFTSALIGARPGTSQSTVLAEARRVLPHGSVAQTAAHLAAEDAKRTSDSLSSLNETLLGFAGIALFVGVFLISNTFTMLVAQRTRELALLRAIGASRRQVRRSVLAEAGVVGVVASVLGFVVGVGLAAALRLLLPHFGAKLPAGPIVITPVSVGAAFAIGVLITLLAAWLPARRAAKIPPVAAMNSVHAEATVKSLVVRNTVGAIVAALGVLAIFGGASVGKDEGRTLIALGAFLLLIGVMVLIPLLSRPTVALVTPILRAFGAAGTLAGRNAVRNPRRTGTTASALAIALTLVTGITVIGVSLGHVLDKMTTDTVRADYMVTAAGAGSLPPSAVAQLRKAPGVTAVSPQDDSGLKMGGTYVDTVGVTPGDITEVLHVDTVSGSLAALARGEAAVPQDTAREHGWVPGDTVRGTFPDGKATTVTVGAVYRSNDFVSGILLDDRLVAPHVKLPALYTIWVATEGGDSAAHEQALIDALGKNPAAKVSDREDIRAAFGGFVNVLLALLYGLLAMALLIAVLGVVNTLAMSVFERRQEVGMLRAVGLDRGGVKRMIRVESVVISLFGAVLGIVLGTFLAWALGRTFADSTPGYTLVVPWERIGIFLVLAGLVGVVAAVWPARSAARLNMLEAIKAE